MRMVVVAAVSLFLLTLGACQNNCVEGGMCNAPSATVSVAVTTTPTMAIEGVQTTLMGPQTVVMLCHPNNSFVLCLWPDGVAFVPGTYSLQVTAPGYQPTTTQAEVIASTETCGCTAGSIQPSIVSIGPTDGGVD